VILSCLLRTYHDFNLYSFCKISVNSKSKEEDTSQVAPFRRWANDSIEIEEPELLFVILE
jgi:hypothetical protein